jgi:hypothetical protein
MNRNHFYFIVIFVFFALLSNSIYAQYSDDVHRVLWRPVLWQILDDPCIQISQSDYYIVHKYDLLEIQFQINKGCGPVEYQYHITHKDKNVIIPIHHGIREVFRQHPDGYLYSILFQANNEGEAEIILTVNGHTIVYYYRVRHPRSNEDEPSSGP